MSEVYTGQNTDKGCCHHNACGQRGYCMINRIEELEDKLAKAVETERQACANVVKHLYEKGLFTKPEDIINRTTLTLRTLAELKGQDDE